MQGANNQIWGLDKDTYTRLALRQSKTYIFLWLVGGLAYNFLKDDLISVSSAWLIFPGIFIAAFAGIPALWMNIKKMQIVPETKNILVLLAFTIWYIVDIAYPVLLSILFIDLVNLMI